MKKLYNWIYEKWLDWKLKKVYPNGVSEEEYQMAIRKLLRKLI